MYARDWPRMRMRKLKLNHALLFNDNFRIVLPDPASINRSCSMWLSNPTNAHAQAEIEPCTSVQ